MCLFEPMMESKSGKQMGSSTESVCKTVDQLKDGFTIALRSRGNAGFHVARQKGSSIQLLFCWYFFLFWIWQANTVSFVSISLNAYASEIFYLFFAAQAIWMWALRFLQPSMRMVSLAGFIFLFGNAWDGYCLKINFWMCMDRWNSAGLLEFLVFAR